MVKILIVEDDKAILKMMKLFLEFHKYKVITAKTKKKAFEKITDKNPDLLIIDWMLPDGNGIDLISRVRLTAIFKQLPIIMLTAKSSTEDIIKGLKTGADDYMVKPIELKELNARIMALLRRTYGINKGAKLKYDNITINLKKCSLKINEKLIKIAKTEFKLLCFFIKHKEQIFTRNQILNSVWGQNAVIDERTVDVYILRLRNTLKPYNADKLIQSMHGIGYLFDKTK